MSRDKGEFDVKTALRALRRQWIVIAACATLVPALALALALHQTKKYTATATLLFVQAPTQQSSPNAPTVNEFDTQPARVVATNVALVSLPIVAEQTAKALGHGITPARVRGDVSVSAGTGDTDAVTISAVDTSPQLAAQIANSFGQQYIQFRKAADTSKILQSQRLIQTELSRLGPRARNTARGINLQNAASQLNIQAALQTGNAELVQLATPPTSPSSPQPGRDVAYGLLLGLVLGLAIALIRHRLDQRIRTADEVVELFERPLLAAVPFARQSNRDGAQDPAVLSEAFQMLRTNLRYFDVSGDRRSVVVTSPLPGDGKSTVSWSLAVAAAKAGQRVLLIEADLRHPSLGRYYTANGSGPKAGLVGVLTDKVPLAEAVVKITVEHRPDVPTATVDVLMAGAIPPNPIDLVESKRMADAIALASSTYDLVVIDTPPTAIVPDAIPILRHVDGVIVVCRLEQTTRQTAIQLRDHLRNLDAPVLGVVVNCLRAGGVYGYGYYYSGYGSTPPPRPWPSRMLRAIFRRDRASGAAPRRQTSQPQPLANGHSGSQSQAAGSEHRSPESAEGASSSERKSGSVA